jgi:four helix bundle protein
VASGQWIENIFMSNKVKNYRDLIIWQKGIDLVKKIYTMTGDFPQEEKFGLTNQLRRSAVSVPSNIAEGQTRQHTNEFRQFLYMALGSLAEVDTQLIIAKELRYISEDDLDEVATKIIEMRKMI